MGTQHRRVTAGEDDSYGDRRQARYLSGERPGGDAQPVAQEADAAGDAAGG